MATVDLNAFTRNPAEFVYTGVTAAVYHISLSISWSSGDIHRIGRLPHGAIPLDAVFFPGSALSATSTIVKFGTSASNDLFFSSATYSTGIAVRTTRALGTAQQISLSDDKMPRYEAVTMVATGGTSVGFVGDLIVYYKMPGQTL